MAPAIPAAQPMIRRSKRLASQAEMEPVIPAAKTKETEKNKRGRPKKVAFNEVEETTGIGDPLGAASNAAKQKKSDKDPFGLDALATNGRS